MINANFSFCIWNEIFYSGFLDYFLRISTFYEGKQQEATSERATSCNILLIY